MAPQDASHIALEWIVVDGSGGKTADAAARTRIRKQAMKRAALARKQRGGWGQQNRLRAPPNTSGGHNLPSGGNYGCTVIQQEPPALPTPWIVPLAPNVQDLVAMCGIDVLGFCSLLNQIHIGRMARSALVARPEQLIALLRYDSGSFGHIWRHSSHHTPCLTDALECLAIIAYRFLRPDSHIPYDRTLRVYVRALRSLHQAVYSSTKWFHPDVLCAAELLSLFEILNHADHDKHDYESAWSKHVEGASQLIQMRGPSRFTGDFERALLFSAASSIVCECLRNNQACFLESEAWQNIYRGAIVPGPTLAFSSELSITLWDLYIRMPRLFQLVSRIVCHQDTIGTAKMEHGLDLIRRFRADLARWRLEFQRMLSKSSLNLGAEHAALVLDSPSAMLGTGLALSLIGNRLLGALFPAAIEDLEDEAQIYATELTQLSADMSVSNPWIGFYLAQKTAMSDALHATTALWRDGKLGERRVIEQWRFNAWCKAIPRATCCDEDHTQTIESLDS